MVSSRSRARSPLSYSEEDRKDYGKTDRCVMEMIAAWLQQQDNVSKNGVPSWSVLQAALSKIGEKQLADEMDQCL